MTRQFAVATPGAGVSELRHRLSGGEDPFLVLDQQGRPRGIVCALDVLVAESNDDRTGNCAADRAGAME
jgi:hypothetical protein